MGPGPATISRCDRGQLCETRGGSTVRQAMSHVPLSASSESDINICLLANWVVRILKWRFRKLTEDGWPAASRKRRPPTTEPAIGRIGTDPDQAPRTADLRPARQETIAIVLWFIRVLSFCIPAAFIKGRAVLRFRAVTGGGSAKLAAALLCARGKLFSRQQPRRRQATGALDSRNEEPVQVILVASAEAAEIGLQLHGLRRHGGGEQAPDGGFSSPYQ
jgi:hypothetical protein